MKPDENERSPGADDRNSGCLECSRRYVSNKEVTILFDGVVIGGKNGLVVPGGVRQWADPSNRFQESQRASGLHPPPSAEVWILLWEEICRNKKNLLIFLQRVIQCASNHSLSIEVPSGERKS